MSYKKESLFKEQTFKSTKLGALNTPPRVPTKTCKKKSAFEQGRKEKVLWSQKSDKDDNDQGQQGEKVRQRGARTQGPRNNKRLELARSLARSNDK